MDAWQLRRQFAEKLLPSITWEDSPQNVVLTGGAVASEDELGAFIPREPFLADGPASRSAPFAIVQSGDIQRDHESPGRSTVRVRIWVCVGSKGITDPTPNDSTTGEDSHGINRTKGLIRDSSSGQGKSTGRDVDEVTFALIDSLNRGNLVDSTHGCQGQVERIGSIEPVSGIEWLARPIDVVVSNGTTFRHYHYQRAFTATGGSGQATFSWKNGPSRYDTYQNVLRRGVAGSGVYPTTPSDGTGVTLTGGVLGESATDSGLVAGDYPYALFAVFSEVNAGDRYARSYTKVVTVT